MMINNNHIQTQSPRNFDLLFGGNIGLFSMLAEKARVEAFEILLAHAQRVGGNAVIGVRYDATEMMPGVTEVLCYGTAVVIENE